MAHRSPLLRSSVLRILTALAISVIGVGCSSGDGGSDGEGGGGVDSNACDQAGMFRACSLTGDQPGSPSGGQECVTDADGNLTWKTCEPAGTASSTPLVLSFDGAPVELMASAHAFDLTGTMSVMTDWPTSATPWLALDRDGNGAIDDGGELFGSATALHDGQRATNGFVALAELDSNADGRITPDDAAWSSLRIWSDSDGDRVSVAGELTSLGARRLLSIDLAYTSAPSCDSRGNCAIERASFRWADEAGVVHTGAVIDVHLKHR